MADFQHENGTLSAKNAINLESPRKCCNFAVSKEKRRFTHGETACCYQKNGLSLRDRQGNDKRRHVRNPEQENQLTLNINH